VDTNPLGAIGMSTDLLYHGFGIHGYEHLDRTFEGGQIRLRHKRASQGCSARGRSNAVRHGEQEADLSDGAAGPQASVFAGVDS
jgi:hypothetical protein